MVVLFLCCGVGGAWLQLGHEKNNQARGLSCVS